MADTCIDKRLLNLGLDVAAIWVYASKSVLPGRHNVTKCH